MAQTFVEQVDGLTTRHGRVTALLGGLLRRIAVMLAGRPGARLAAALGIVVGRDTLLRLVRRLADPAVGPLPRVGVDDFALRRGHVYGTVIVDMDTHRPVDVLGDRTADTLADWLRAHPGVELVCRDRAGAYAEAVRVGAPHAVQVADRWHLWKNLCQAVEKTVIGERAALCEPQPDSGTGAPDALAAVGSSIPAPEPAPIQPGRLAVRTQERYDSVQRLIGAGRSISAISRELGLDRKTVRRFAEATSVEELLSIGGQRGSLLDRFKPYLHEQFNTGHTDAAQLTREITALGYRGSAVTVRRYLAPFRPSLTAPAAVPVAPTVRQVTGWLTRHPDRLTEDDRLRLKQVLQRSDTLAATYRLVGEFAVMLTERHGHHLQSWLGRVDTHGAAPLRSFAAGVRTDVAAVTAGLTVAHSSGPVEGAVCRIKAIKRQMYGRAGFDLLRKRILHPA